MIHIDLYVRIANEFAFSAQMGVREKWQLIAFS